MILVSEFTNNPYVPWAKFQAREEGAQIIKNQYGVEGFATFTYRFDNVGTDGLSKEFNVIRAGDGRALMPNGSWSMMTIDSKNWNYYYNTLLTDLSQQNRFVDYLKTLTSALRQNPGYTHVINFNNDAARNAVASIIRDRAANLGEDFGGGESSWVLAL